MVRRSSAPNTWRIEHLLDRVTLKPADLLDQLSLLRLIDEVRPHEIYNLAAMSFVPASWDQPMLTGEFNAQGVTRCSTPSASVDPSIRFYQASSSEMFGKVREVPQTELTPFYPRSPYGVSKVFAHYITVNYRESYDLFAVSGMLFNHESPRRGLEFVTRKVTDGVARIKLGLADTLSIGNLDAQRDWGFAGDYVRAMWLMLQQERAGRLRHRHRRQPLGAGAGRDRVRPRRPRLAEVRPASIPRCFGRPKSITCSAMPSKARTQLGWTPTVDFKQLVEMMVDADLERWRRVAVERRCRAGNSAGATMTERAVERLLDRIRTRTGAASASSGSATSACRWPSSSRAPGFDVTGFDVDESKIEPDQRRPELHPRRAGRPSSREVVKAGRLRATTDMAELGDMDVIDICVPTPLRKTKDPDLSYVVKAVEAVGGDAHAGPAGHPRVDDLSGHDRRSRAADARGASGLQGRRRFLPRVLARARRSGQRRSTRRATSRRSSAASARRAPRPRARSTARSSPPSCRSARRASPRW